MTMEQQQQGSFLHNNPQEPPPPSPHRNADNALSYNDAANSKKRLPTCVFDLFFDLPHPAASTAEKAKIVDPPVAVSPLLAKEMYNPDNITRISQFAFPEHDDASSSPHAGSGGAAPGVLTSGGRALGAHLMKHDVYHVDHVVHHHTFSLLLSDGATRVHGHVRRYLPTHGDAGFRMDVGRRRPRAMVLLTRAKGGERFYSSVLKTVESVMVESKVNKRGCFAKKKDPARSFLHALFNAHATLITQYAELRRHGLTLNFTQAGKSRSACDTAKAIMEENEDLFRITLDKLEFGAVGSIGGEGLGGGAGNKKRTNVSNIRIENDIVRFYLPSTLQPGFECLPAETIPEDITSPIIPLLRYIGPSHLVRLISALLCERRIVLISKSISRLSMCVRAASSVLAQGLLLWRHILIPIVPPHMLRFLSVQAPYLVGILHPFASRLGKIEGLTDVLCVNLDKNQLKTLNMANPRATVPDMLKKVGKKSSSDAVGAAECLARDLDEIMKADQTLWQQEEKAGGHNEKGGKENGVTALDTSEHENTAIKVDSLTPSKQTFLSKLHPMKKHVANNKFVMSLEEKRQYETSVDAAVAFGKMIRKSFGKDAGEDGDDPDNNDEDDFENQANAAPKYAAPSHDVDMGAGGVEPSAVTENEGGEEDVRAALTCFFIHLYGDMGMYLSETHGTFWLDRRKFLLRKKQLGEKETAPTFVVLQKFSASAMFATHVKSRIDDLSMTARDRASIMPHHIPLFDVCSKYLSVHRLDFSLINVRRIVARTVLACTRHLAVERHVAIRTKALALTDDTPFDGNVAAAIAEIVEACHECNTNLGAVMSVIWHRLHQTDETKKTNMHVLLALHLLKNLVSHGPLTAVTEALDGAGKIYELKSYSDAKSAEHNYEVRQAADHVYSLLVDLSALFARRRRIAFSRAQQRVAVSTNQSMWSDYLVSRLPLTVNAEKLHALFRPEGADEKVFHHASGDDHTASIQAFGRLGKDLRNSRMEATHDGGEEDLLFGDDGGEDPYLDEGDDPYLDEGGVPAEQYLNEGGGAPANPYLDGSGVSGRDPFLDGSGASGRDPYLDGSGVSGRDPYLDGSGVSGRDSYLDGGGISGANRYLDGSGVLGRGQYLDGSGVSGSNRYLDGSGVSGRDQYLDESVSGADGYLDVSSVMRSSALRHDPYLDQSSVADRYVPPVETMPPVGESRDGSPPKPNDAEEGRGGAGFPEDLEHGVSAEDLFSEAQDQFSFPAHAFASQGGSSLLDSFNYAVSSNAGTSQAGGSQYGEG